MTDPERPHGTDEHWARTTEIFTAALDVPAAERRAWLVALPGIDEAVRREVASLLDADEKAERFLAPGAIQLPE